MESAVDKFLAFCQALIKSDQKFTLNLTIGNGRLFFSNKEQESSWKKKKKKSPSQVRREEHRRRNRQNKATEEVADNGADEATVEKAECNSAAKAEVPAVISCEECGYKATTEKGLKQHKRMKHRKLQQPNTSLLSTPEATRRQTMDEDLNSSPLLNITRDETCHNCGEIFTSDHQCDTGSEQIDEDEKRVDGGDGGEVAVASGSPCTCTNKEWCCVCYHETSCQCYRTRLVTDGSGYCDCESVSDVACNSFYIPKAKSIQKT